MPTDPEMSELDEIEARLECVAVAWDAFVAARAAMNAAIPDVVTATRAERDLYDERCKADTKAEREHHRTAIILGQGARSILDTIRSLREQVREAKVALEPFATFDVPLHEDEDWKVAQSIYSSASLVAGEFRRARTVHSKLGE